LPFFALLTACSGGEILSPVPTAASSAPGPAAIPPSIELKSEAAVVTLTTAPFSMKITKPDGTAVLDTLPADATIPADDAHAYGPLGATHRFTHIKPTFVIEGWDHTRSSDDPWTHPGFVMKADVTATHAQLSLSKTKDGPAVLRVDFTLDGGELKVDAVPTGDAPPVLPDDVDQGDDSPPGWNELGQAFRLDANEHFLGLGERYVTVDHRGTHYECWTEEGGLGGGEKALPGPMNPSPNGPSMTHLPIPLLISSRGYALWVDTTYRTGFVLGEGTGDAWRFYANAPELHYRLFVANPRDMMARYTTVTGRAPLPAPWVFGPRRRVDSNSMAKGMLETTALRKFGVPTTMADDTNHFLPIASEKGHEAELAAWTKEMHSWGYKPIGYYNAYVSVDDPRSADLIAYGRAHDLFVKMADGTEFDAFMISAGGQMVATIDMSNPTAVEWYGTILQRALDLGYDGWMLDFGEYVPPKGKMFDGRSGWEAHNDFPRMYQKATFDYLTKVRGDDFMFFARSGYSGTQAHVPVIWSGDPAASFDDTRGLPANVRAGINAGLSGIPFWGSDISGYTCLHDGPPDKDVYLRWAEFGALSSDMHDENACSQAPPGSPPKWNVWSDDETLQVYGRYARLHTRLNPYLHAAAKEAVDTGLPIMRHPVFVHPNVPEAWSVELEYYFGSALYVAPVVRRGATTRSLWLPPGKWADWWTSGVVAGGATITRDAPLDLIPMYLRSGGIVAMLDPSVDTIAPDSRDDVVSAPEVAGILDVRAAIDRATASGQTTLTDGTTLSVAMRDGSVSLPTDYPNAKSEAELTSCDHCAKIDPVDGGIRVRVTTASEGESELVLGALSLKHGGGTKRVRWDMVVIP
jgi:alpha-glucosidase (family GH31 glycosyl hydrolase)